MTHNLNHFKPFLTEYVERITEPSPDGAKNKYICPLCSSGTGKNRSGAFSITEDGLNWKCFSCNASGDIADLVKKVQPGTDTNYKAMKYLNSVFGETTGNTPKKETPVKTAEQLSAEELLKERDRYVSELGKHPEAVAYLTGRGLTADTLKKAFIGYDPERNAVIIPYNAEMTYYTARSISEKKYYKPKRDLYGAEPIFNEKALTGERPVFITEAQLCALSIIQEMSGTATAIALGGTGTEKLKRIIESNTVTAPALIVCLDNDDAGKENADRLITYLTAESTKQHYKGRIIAVNWAEITEKDPNELLQANKGTFKAFLEKAMLEYSEAEKNAKESEIQALKFYNANNLWNRYIENEFNRTKIIKTEWGELDKYLGGGIFPSLYVLGAGSSIGKTTFLVQLADQIAQNNVIQKRENPDFSENHILFFSLEQSAPELIAKSITRLVYEANAPKKSNVRTQDLLIKELNAKLSKEDKDQADYFFNTVYQQFGKYIYYYEAGAERIGVEDIRDKVKRHINATGVKPVVMVDYLQILKPFAEDKNAGDRERLDHNVSELKKISAEYNIPVIVLSSINRNSYDRAPGMESLKGSGGIEYGADVVLSLEPSDVFTGRTSTNREKLKQHRLSEDNRSIILNIHKNRNGALAYKGNVLYCLFEPKYNYFGLSILAKRKGQEPDD